MLREYTVKDPDAGRYTIKVNYYSKNRSDLTSASILWCTIYSNLNMPNEAKVTTACRLEIDSTNPTGQSMFTLCALDK